MFSRSKDTNEPGFLQRHFGHQVGSVVAFIFDVLQIVIVSAAIIMVIRYFLIQPFYVKGASMEPNFYDREYLIIDELTFRFRAPERGEIVVFRYPRDPSQYFIKRIVGLPGETVEVIDGHVVVYNDIYPNGIILEEAYLDDSVTEGKKKVTLGTTEYYVLGDNRDESLDSRSFGPVLDTFLVGRVWIRGLPLSRIGHFTSPEYQF